MNDRELKAAMDKKFGDGSYDVAKGFDDLLTSDQPQTMVNSAEIVMAFKKVLAEMELLYILDSDSDEKTIDAYVHASICGAVRLLVNMGVYSEERGMEIVNYAFREDDDE